MSGRIGFLTCSAVALFTAGVARAQTAPTCAFDPAPALLTVSVDGSAELRAVAATGEIRLDGGACAGATVFNTDAIQVNYVGPFEDVITLAGRFVPGFTPEAAGVSEIEISVAGNSSGRDEVIVTLTGRNDRLVFTTDGIDVGDDGDQDILTAGTARITVDGGGGNDRIDASVYEGSNGQLVPGVELHGGPGNDVLIGARVQGNALYGEDGDDVLRGGDGEDWLHGGMGNDRMIGNRGNDVLWQEASADGADDIRGGDGNDQVHYDYRVNGVTVTIGDTEPDGEPGEGDLVHGDVEVVVGGQGPDVLVGNYLANALLGGAGADELYGGAGNDSLYGSTGNDILVGDGGNDVLEAGPGDDFLDGGPGADDFYGRDGNDTFVNADGFAETVDCGAGTGDDPEPSALDTFIGCEEI